MGIKYLFQIILICISRMDHKCEEDFIMKEKLMINMNKTTVCAGV